MAEAGEASADGGGGAHVVVSVPGFHIEEELVGDGAKILRVHGELDLATGPVLGQRVRRPLFWTDVDRMIVDLSGVGFIDSTGTRTLMLSHAHAVALERDVRFVCPEGSVLRRLQVYGLAQRLPMYGSLEAALAA